MKTLKKIYYVPGMISAILIPLVFWYLGNRELQKPIPNVMDIGLPAKVESAKNLVSQYDLNPSKDLNSKKIIVPSKLAKSNSKFYVSEIKKLTENNIKYAGLEFVLNKNSTYGDFASILNDFHIAKNANYFIDLNGTGNVFAVVNYKDPNKIDEPCYLCNDQISQTFYQFKYEQILSENRYSKWFLDFFYSIKPSLLDFFKLPNSAFLIVFGYFILFCISIFSLRKRQF
ncbi:hypothetical protein [Halpernia frigidisoli]|uniref:Uncharacterized protein n=1 Tax=Halpernia frigidisoli TaxID=1125876 RepID=A0A1I3D252_9FLAO|nr:hypothetical protein [Halpernia frigidisoli]SFH80864.1 hypothetical protein SAMN05443292_0219 [Halpernia frigidisoli]